MDPRVAGAGVAMAVAMVMLLPTFNALNNSYATDVPPPPWLPQPDEIPENFQPPPDFEPPEGWEPPPDMEPPPGWEPPPGYEGPIPPGGCPPPVIMELEEWNRQGSFSPSSATTFGPWEFELPKYAYAFGGYVNFTNWQASQVSFLIEGPNGTVASDSQNGPAGGLLVAFQTVEETSWSYDSREDGEFPPEGSYTLTLNVNVPVDGDFQTEFIYVLPCGGLLS